jgi:hypothetical protein
MFFLFVSKFLTTWTNSSSNCWHLANPLVNFSVWHQASLNLYSFPHHLRSHTGLLIVEKHRTPSIGGVTFDYIAN